MRDIYQEITDKIIAELEAGALPWQKCWTGGVGSGMPYNLVSGKDYTGINAPLLMMAATSGGFKSDAWVTFKQAKAKGGSVMKGSKGTSIIFWKINKIKDKASGKDKTIPLLRFYTVFNLDQCEGITLPESDAVPTTQDERNAIADSIIAATGAKITEGHKTACYIPAMDCINVPSMSQFKDSANYYGTMFHELAHWTGHEARLDRNLTGRFGSESYAAEELVAEMSAAFTCGSLGITGDMRHAGYIASWLRVLKQDKKAIFTASKLASQATEFVKTGEKPAYLTEQLKSEEKAA